jgi:hypothetical protein
MTWHFLIAQCVMCYRTAAAQQLERSRVLNKGILILLVPPILVLAGILLLAYRKSRVGRVGHGFSPAAGLPPGATSQLKSQYRQSHP